MEVDQGNNTKQDAEMNSDNENENPSKSEDMNIPEQKLSKSAKKR